MDVHFVLLLNIVLKDLAIGQEKDISLIHMEKQDVEASPFADKILDIRP